MGKSKRQRSESKKVFRVQLSARPEVEIKDRYKAHGARCKAHNRRTKDDRCAHGERLKVTARKLIAESSKEEGSGFQGSGVSKTRGRDKRSVQGARCTVHGAYTLLVKPLGTLVNK
jgi:hypothetical protein